MGIAIGGDGVFDRWRWGVRSEAMGRSIRRDGARDRGRWGARSEAMGCSSRGDGDRSPSGSHEIPITLGRATKIDGIDPRPLPVTVPNDAHPVYRGVRAGAPFLRTPFVVVRNWCAPCYPLAFVGW